MAQVTYVNGQITDAVSQSGVTALANAPAQGLATAYQTGAHSTGLAMQNAVANQRQTTSLSGSTATQAVAQVLTLAPAHSARATVETFDGQAFVRELLSLSVAALAAGRRNASHAEAVRNVAEGMKDVADAANLAARPLRGSNPDGSGADATLTGGNDNPNGANDMLFAPNPSQPTPAPKETDMSAEDRVAAVQNAAATLQRHVTSLVGALSRVVDSGLLKDLSDAAHDLHVAVSRLGKDTGSSASGGGPSGGTPSGPPGGGSQQHTFIVGSGNTQPAAGRIVGSSW